MKTPEQWLEDNFGRLVHIDRYRLIKVIQAIQKDAVESTRQTMEQAGWKAPSWTTDPPPPEQL